MPSIAHASDNDLVLDDFETPVAKPRTFGELHYLDPCLRDIVGHGTDDYEEQRLTSILTEGQSDSQLLILRLHLNSI